MKITRIRNLREDNDYTQKDIAKVLRITQPQYNLYEQGDRKIPIDKLELLADFYNVSIDYILGRTNYKRVVQAETMQSKNLRLQKYYSRLSAEDQDYIIGRMVSLYRKDEE